MEDAKSSEDNAVDVYIRDRRELLTSLLSGVIAKFSADVAVIVWSYDNSWLHEVKTLVRNGDLGVLIGPTMLEMTWPQMKKLRVLNLTDVLPAEVPRVKGKLKKVRISHLPNGIGLLRNLRKLNLSGNHLKSVPEDISALSHLVHLNLSNNFVTSIPHQEAIFA
mmetsp:Transcript_23362/g.56659  ORF Transcript_23362/g.56659 Transcript_23362/m.56659 type:complete len:164 (-) Transcript_23362:219-710(-)